MRARHAPARTRSWFRLTGWLALALLLQQPVAALAQAAGGEHRLKGGDQIVLSVPGRQDLDRTLTLDASGRVSIPQVGEVALSGLTIAEAREILRQRLRVFYPAVAAVDVELQGASQVRLYVLGEVTTSGQFDFSSVPTVWDLLRSAGGPTENANLARRPHRARRGRQDGRGPRGPVGDDERPGHAGCGAAQRRHPGGAGGPQRRGCRVGDRGRAGLRLGGRRRWWCRWTSRPNWCSC